MACSIRINQVTGNRDAGGNRIVTVSIDGTAVECAAVKILLNVWGENERERLINTPEILVEAIDANGRWRVEIDVTDPENVVPNARPAQCGDHYEAYASNPDPHVKDCYDTKRGLFCNCPCIQVSVTEEECINDLRTVRFDVEITAGDEVAVVALSSGIRGDDLVENFVAQAGQTVNDSARADYPTGEVFTAVFDILNPLDCEPVTVQVGPLAPCVRANCPDIKVSVTEEECVNNLRMVRFHVKITAGDEVAVVELSSGIRENDHVENFVALPGQPVNDDSVTWNYPTGEIFTAVFDILTPIGCEPVRVQVGPLVPCCLAEDDVLLKISPESDCIVEGRDVTFDVCDTSDHLLDDDEYDFKWRVNGNDVGHIGNSYIHRRMEDGIVVEVVIQQEGCPDVRLTRNVALCECPREPDFRIVPQEEPGGHNRDGEPCYEDIPGNLISFRAEGGLPPEEIFARTWLIYKLNENDDQEGAAIRAEDGIFEINGTTLRIVRRLEEGGYQVTLILGHREIPGCAYARDLTFNICPKNLSCPQFDAVVTPADDNRTFNITVTIPQADDVAAARENGMRIDFGDSVRDYEGEEIDAATGVLTVQHAYPNSDADYTVTVSFPWAGGPCRQSENIHVDRTPPPPPPPPPENGEDECADGCAWYDLRCWCLCDILGRILALLIAATLIAWAQGAIPGDGAGIGIAVAGYVYLIWCDKCDLAKYTLVGVGIFLVVYLVMLILALISGTALAFLLASWPALVAAVVLAIAAAGVLNWADECQ